MRVSVLDLSPIPAGATAGEALASSIDLARFADARGLHRIWFAEHHNAAALASSSPEIMIGQAAQATKRIRVGAGGIILPNHAPLRVAESFRVLHALFPGRIDLGVGRAAGTDPRTARALRRVKSDSTAAISGDEFPAQLDELTAYLAQTGGPRRAFEPSIVAIPAGVAAPDIWILGSSEEGALFAAQRGLPFAFAHHINPRDAESALTRYREGFRPSKHRASPDAILAASVVCAETNEEAARLATSVELADVRMSQGLRDVPLPSVHEAAAHTYDEIDIALRAGNRGRHIIGAPDAVAAALRDLAEASGADEVMLMVHVHDDGARKRTYDLVAGALGL